MQINGNAIHKTRQKKREKVCSLNHRERGYGFFWPEGGYAHEAIIVLVGLGG